MAISSSTMAPRSGQSSGLLGYLPAIFQSKPDNAAPDDPLFLGRLLMAFESVLLGLGKSGPAEWAELNQLVGLEEILGGAVDPISGKKLLDGVQRYFEPGANLGDGDPSLPPDYQRVPRNFLAWLAGWVSLTLRDDWDDSRKRNFIARAVQLYRLRGTRSGVAQFVEVYTGLPVDINEMNTEFQLGVHSQIGVDTILDGGAPFFFRVQIHLPLADPLLFKRETDIATAIIELQKPAHTSFSLEVITPQFQIGVQSTIGVDTMLGQV
jgi:hypothetical protein